MMNSPWAMLITPICPKVRARPRAASSSIEPSESPATSWLNSACTTRPLAGQALGPVVALEEGIRLDGRTGTPIGVDQRIGADLADQCSLGDVMVCAVDGHRALGRVVTHTVCCLADIVGLERLCFLHHCLPQEQ